MPKILRLTCQSALTQFITCQWLFSQTSCPVQMFRVLFGRYDVPHSLQQNQYNYIGMTNGTQTLDTQTSTPLGTFSPQHINCNISDERGMRMDQALLCLIRFYRRHFEARVFLGLAFKFTNLKLPVVSGCSITALRHFLSDKHIRVFCLHSTQYMTCSISQF